MKLRLLATVASAALLAAGVCGGVAPVRAESLADALASAYRYNPRLDAERARLRATDENVAIAMSGFRPSVTGQAEVSVENTDVRPDPGQQSGTVYPKTYAVNINQSIFQGLTTVNAVSESEANVRAGRETLRSVEQEVLLEAVTAFMDVVRDQAIVQLRENNVNVLSRELKATQDRFAVGEVTKTDVAQSQARRAGSVSQLDLARANLKASRATYERVIGHPPDNLVEPRGYERALPKSLDEAIGISAQENPDVVGALYREEAARRTVDKIRGELLPRVDVEAQYVDSFDTSRNTNETESASVTGRLTVPIYESGEVYARVRQAKHIHVSRLQEIEQARTEVQAFVTSAWSQLLAARAQLESDRVQVEANQTALTGTREEERVGQRTVLDVLDAELELLNAQVQLVTTRRNLVVSSYSVLSTIGRLDVAGLGVASTVYDPEVHYGEVRRKWFGISITHEDGRSEELTVQPSGDHAPAK